jgi:hypothetical protein
MAGLYAICFPSRNADERALAMRIVEAEALRTRAVHNEQAVLAQACAQTANEWSARLPGHCKFLVRPPFVLGGDLTTEEYDRMHREVVRPVAEALWRAFFDRRPDQPITILATSGQTVFRDLALRLDGYRPGSYAGYTQRGERRIVVDASTGPGTLAHELAHVLAAFDFPQMPEWFDEGLAALHEEAEFTADGLLLVGRTNWRVQLLVDALSADRLAPLSAVVTSPSFRGESESLNYAQARGFCHYLQERGMLHHFYRKYREAVRTDPGGMATLCELLNCGSVEEIDGMFRDWLATMRQPAAP